jgi:hypothetical protein
MMSTQTYVLGWAAFNVASNRSGEPSAHRLLGIVLMRSRIPKISEHPIAEILRYHAIQLFDLVGTRRLEGSQPAPAALPGRVGLRAQSIPPCCRT